MQAFKRSPRVTVGADRKVCSITAARFICVLGAPRAHDKQLAVRAVTQDLAALLKKITHRIHCFEGLALYSHARGGGLHVFHTVKSADCIYERVQDLAFNFRHIHKRPPAPAVAGALWMCSAAGKLLTVGQDLHFVAVRHRNYFFAYVFTRLMI